MNAPDSAILGLGYLGLPLAEKLHQNGSSIAAVKRRFHSDDINLPLALDCADLNQPEAFEADFWAQHWQNKPTWICLLPPSALTDYPASIRRWLALARRFNVQHIIYGSSISVYGNEARHCDEHSPTAPQTDSARATLAAEEAVLNSGIAHIDILRLGGLYSATRHPLTSLLKRNHIAGACAPVNMLHQDRAVAALYHAATHPDGCRIRNIVEAAHPPKQQFYRQEAAKLGLPEADFNPADLSTGKTVGSCHHDFAHLLT